MRFYTVIFVLLTLQQALNAQPSGGTLIFSDQFDLVDDKKWIIELSSAPGNKVYASNGNIVLDTKGGVTAWLNKELSGNIRIEYLRKVLVDSGSNDRLSDLNTFWMASDPRKKNLFTRNGVLERYDSLRLYYVGMGGNTNSTTRFRKYEGNGERRLIKEYTDSAHLLRANREYLIAIEVKGNTVTYSVNGDIYFEYTDTDIIRQGYFGFRSTKSRQAIDWIRIYQLP